MKTKTILLIGFLLTLSLINCSNHQIKGDLIISNVNVVDVAESEIVPHQTITIIGNEIISITPYSEEDEIDGTTIIDGNGKYVIPGLWDMHTHALWENVTLFNKLMVANGVTGFRDMWGSDSVASKFRQGINNGTYLPQRFIYANHMIDGDPPIWEGTVSVSNMTEAINVVDSLAETDTDFIKVYSNLSKESFLAVAERSRELGIDMVGHIPTSVPAEEAIKAGLKSIEHLYGIIEAHSPLRDSLMASGPIGMREQVMMLFNSSKTLEDSLNQLMIEKEVWLVPTFALWDGYTRIASPYDVEPDPRVKYLPRDITENWTADKNKFISKMSKKMFETWTVKMNRHKEIIQNAHEAGVGILAGTDVSASNPYTFPGFSLHDELSALVESGLSNGEALQTATINPAIYLHASDSLGQISEEYLADLVVLNGDPLKDISNTRQISGVITDGVYLNRKELNSLLSEAYR